MVLLKKIVVSGSKTDNGTSLEDVLIHIIDYYNQPGDMYLVFCIEDSMHGVDLEQLKVLQSRKNLVNVSQLTSKQAPLKIGVGRVNKIN